MLRAERAENERLRQIIKELQRHRFGRRAESLPQDQLLLGLEEAEQVEAEGLADEEAADPAKREARARKRRANRGSLPANLPRIERVIDIEDKACPCCRGELHMMGSDISERLDVVPAQFRVIVTRRPKYACRACYAPDRKAEQPMRHLHGFVGVLQVDGYAGYKVLAERNAVSLAFCWSHVRRRFYELAQAGPAPIATEALARIAELYRIEGDIRGHAPEQRRAVRQARSRPVVDALEPWLREKLALLSQKSKLAEAIRYGLARWQGLTRYIDDGRIEIDNNVVERAIRPIALNRKNALFAGSDGGAEHWATIASLVETCKLNNVEPLRYLADILTRIVEGHPNSQIDDLLPWAYTPKPLTAVA